MQGVPALGFYLVSLKVELFQHCGVNTCVSNVYAITVLTKSMTMLYHG